MGSLMYEYKQKHLMFEALRWVGTKEIGNNGGQIVSYFNARSTNTHRVNLGAARLSNFVSK